MSHFTVRPLVSTFAMTFFSDDFEVHRLATHGHFAGFEASGVDEVHGETIHLTNLRLDASEDGVSFVE